MFMFAQMGLGLLANLVAGGAQRAQAAQQQQQAMKDMQQTLNDTTRVAIHQTQEMDFTPANPLDQEAPPFPDKAAEQLNQRQTANAEQRQGVVAQTRDELADMKTGFFEDHHLEVFKDHEGKPQVALNEHGRPQVQAGKENPEQKVARETFETKQKGTLDENHHDEKQSLVRDEKQQLTTFLQNNKPDLGNPAVQGELQKMIMQSHKKALNLTRRQEEEDVKFDLYSPEQVAHADKKIGQLRDMEDRQAREEDNSPEAQTLYSHQQDLAELLRRKREEANESQMEEMFLKGRPNFKQPAAPTRQEVDVASVLPPFLSNHLYGMGIYTV